MLRSPPQVSTHHPFVCSFTNKLSLTARYKPARWVSRAPGAHGLVRGPKPRQPGWGQREEGGIGKT